MDSDAIDRRACSLIVILGYDLMDFLEDVPNEDTAVLLKALEYLPLQDTEDTKTRDVGINVIQGQLRSRGVSIPEPTPEVPETDPTWSV